MAVKAANARVPALEILRVNLIVERARKRLSQGELAARAGISRPTVSRIERAAGDVGIEVVQRIADALEVAVTDLFAPFSPDEPDDAELARRLAAPVDEFIDAEDLIRALDEATGRSIRRYSRAGRPRVAR